jgi:hypothetical protein
MDLLFLPVGMNAALWLLVYLATKREYRLRQHYPERYTRSG